MYCAKPNVEKRIRSQIVFYNAQPGHFTELLGKQLSKHTTAKIILIKSVRTLVVQYEWPGPRFDQVTARHRII